MNIEKYIMPIYLNTWDEFCKKTTFKPIITKDKAIKILTNYPDKRPLQDLIYLTCITDCYNNGPKCIEPTFEQCMTFENIEANIPLKEYRQIYRTVIIEFPEQYQAYLRNKYNHKSPTAAIIYWEGGVFLISVFFSRKDPCITLFVSPFYENDTIEQSIISTLKKKGTTDKDYLMSADVLRMCTNLNLFAVNFGFERKGFKYIKQHRFLERKKPTEAKKDTEYFSLKQNIKLYRKEYFKKSENLSETERISPKPHWRKGHYRNQH